MRDTITLRVSEDQKDRWQHHAQHWAEYDDMSDLIRTSVERTINADKSDSDDVDAPQLEELTQLIDSVEKIDSHIREAKNEIETISEEQATAAQLEDNTDEIIHRLDTLPIDIAEVQDDES